VAGAKRGPGERTGRGAPLRLAIAAVAAGALLPSCTYPGISPTSKLIPKLYFKISLLAGLVVALVVIWLALDLILFRARKGDDTEPPQREGRAPFVVGFFLIGLVIVSTLFPFGEQTLASVDKIHPAQLHLTMIGFQWEWTAEYQENGLVVSGTTATPTKPQKPLVFELPVDTPVQITLESNDVMHEFFVPQMLFMRNAVPGHPNTFTFTPTVIGSFHGQCAQFCGLWHSRMTFTMNVVSEVDFLAWVKSEQKTILEQHCPTKSSPISITAHNIQWNTKCLNITAGASNVLTMTNLDNGIDHNFAIYTSPARTHQLFQGPTFSGVKTESIKLPNLPPGTYYFQCNIHGPAMSGAFIVSKS